jgi:hypothetical protein
LSASVTWEGLGPFWGVGQQFTETLGAERGHRDSLWRASIHLLCAKSVQEDRRQSRKED